MDSRRKTPELLTISAGPLIVSNVRVRLQSVRPYPPVVCPEHRFSTDSTDRSGGIGYRSGLLQNAWRMTLCFSDSSGFGDSPGGAATGSAHFQCFQTTKTSFAAARQACTREQGRTNLAGGGRILLAEPCVRTESALRCSSIANPCISRRGTGWRCD